VDRFPALLLPRYARFAKAHAVGPTKSTARRSRPALRLVCLGLVLLPLDATAQIEARQDPSTYVCADYIAAGAPPARERAERMLHWLAGHVGGRLAAAAPDGAASWPFPALSAHIHSHLLTSCPGHPGMTMPAIAEGIVSTIGSMVDTPGRPAAK
jgi:hypothetical protein